MSNVENLNIWNKAVDLSVNIYTLTKVNKNLKYDFGLKDQIQRASVSIGSNIAEGRDRDTQKEFSRFLCIARGSCSELKTQVLIISKLGYLTQKEFDSIYKQIIDIHKMINGLIQKIRGYKYAT